VTTVSPTSPPPARGDRRAEAARLLLLAAVATWLLHPFATTRQIGAGDALWYANMLADFVTQLRAGVFPIFVGQTDYAFNGAVYPLRVAPFYQHLAGVLDLLTGRQLGVFALQHLSVLFVGYAGIFSSYFALNSLAPGQRWSAAGLAILYLSCPGLLGTIYTQDLYMTWMTIPFVPWAVYGIARPFIEDSLKTQIILGAALAALWWAHAPIALWLTLIAVAAQGLRIVVLHRTRAHVGRAFWGGVTLVLLAHYPFVSLASLQTGAAPATDILPRAHLIAEHIRDVFPGVVLPISTHARVLSDLQLGYALWLVLTFGTGLALKTRRPHLIALTLAGAGLLLLILPVPGNAWVWDHLPETLKRLTYYWPMQRFYLIIAALAAGAGISALAAGMELKANVTRRLRILLLIACGWSLWESRQYVAAGRERTASAEITAQNLRPENRPTMNHAYGLFPALPAYFSHGVMDPRAEARLLDHTTLAVLPATPSTTEPALTPLRGTVDANPGVVLLSPSLTLQPGLRYALEFVFAPKSYVGILQLSGRTFFREYALPQSGEALAFGSEAPHSPILSLWTTASEPETITLRFIPTDGTAPQTFAAFADIRLREINDTTTAVNVTAQLPFRATVLATQPAWLETPRMYQAGYRATVDSSATSIKKSPQGLTMIELQPGAQTIMLTYQAPHLVRLSYTMSLLLWLLTFFLIVRFQRTERVRVSSIP
jgi:hypothetical protein